MMAPLGSNVELYSWGQVLSKPSRIIVCEGEFDQLVCEAQGFRAVTSTGGAGSFKAAWIREFARIPEVYICFDNDDAGREGARRVARMIPHAKVVTLPQEVGDGGDVTDFFIRLQKGKADFLKLLEDAKFVPPSEKKVLPKHRLSLPDFALSDKASRIKHDVPIHKVVEHYVRLRQVGNHLIGRCPFHKDSNPSFAVFPETGTFHCFGCRGHGDVISFLRMVEHMSFPRALEVLNQFNHHHGEQSQKNR